VAAEERTFVVTVAEALNDIDIERARRG